MSREEVFTLPNIITIFRMLLVLPVVLMLINKNFEIAAALFIIAAFSDMADGFLARALNKITKIGAILDPLADKLLLNYTFIILATEELIPKILLMVVLFKDIVLTGGSIIEIWSLKNIEEIKIKASLSGKISTLLQVTVVFLVFLEVFNIYYQKRIFYFVVYLTIFLSLLSLGSYVLQYKKRTQREV